MTEGKGPHKALESARESARVAYAELVYLVRGGNGGTKDAEIALDAAIAIAEAMDILDRYTEKDPGADRAQWLRSMKGRR